MGVILSFRAKTTNKRTDQAQLCFCFETEIGATELISADQFPTSAALTQRKGAAQPDHSVTQLAVTEDKLAVEFFENVFQSNSIKKEIFSADLLLEKHEN